MGGRWGEEQVRGGKPRQQGVRGQGGVEEMACLKTSTGVYGAPASGPRRKATGGVPLKGSVEQPTITLRVVPPTRRLTDTRKGMLCAGN